MRELVGQCQICGEKCLLREWVFDGVHEDGKLMCNDCADENGSK